MSNIIASQLIALSKARMEQKATKEEMTEQQRKVQDIYSRFDFGCHNESVAEILGALTGRKPVKNNTLPHKIGDALVLPAGVRGVVLGISGIAGYLISVDHPWNTGCYTFNAGVEKPSKKQALQILERFSTIEDWELLEWVNTKLSGAYPKQLFDTLK